MDLLDNLYNSKDLWITDAILYEFGDGLCKTNRESASEFIKSCLNSDLSQLSKLINHSFPGPSGDIHHLKTKNGVLLIVFHSK